ncbi:hypothetical protein ACFL0F_00230 [Patescibacteria group bacterium]
MDENLITKADRLQKVANEIIKETGVATIFSRIGTVNFVGSYKLGLMSRPDIDMAIISTTPEKSKAVDITTELIQSEKFQTVGLADWFLYQGKNLKKGYYWELVYVFNEVYWKFDIWYSTKEEDDSIGPTERKQVLLEKNPSAKKTILRLKHEFYDGVKYKDKVNGNRIYRAVLEHGVTDAQGLKKFVSGLE